MMSCGKRIILKFRLKKEIHSVANLNRCEFTKYLKLDEIGAGELSSRY